MTDETSGGRWTPDDDIESLLTTVWQSGEWDEDHDAMLARWRERRGDAGKTSWRWWWTAAGDDLYATEHATREDALAAARAAEGEDVAIEVIEARCWSDEIQGDEQTWFAETRNHEVIPARAALLKAEGRGGE